jgi:murein DD-endopeptidase MepM/ murein hydrolase activator NlpD
VAAPIEDSFYQAGRDAGLPAPTLARMIKLLSWDVDFQRDVHPGDRLEAVFRQLLNEDGESAGEGELDFVGLATGGRSIEAYRHDGPDGRSDYYDRQGRSLRKWLLKTPVDGARLSSGFGSRRHPVLGYTRMHRGIDFAAPQGTPVLAAGAGVIEAAGRNRGYGNYLRLRHNRGYATAYAHLARFAPGMRPGRRVEQGEVIGHVGATGLATGPHLHYELLVDGRQVNPLSVDLAGGEPLQGAELARFVARRDAIDRERRAAGGLVADGQPASRLPEAL